MIPDEEEPKNEGDATPEPRAEEEVAPEAFEPPQLSDTAPPERIVETPPIADEVLIAQEPAAPEMASEPEPQLVEPSAPVAADEPPPELPPEPMFEAPPETVRALEPEPEPPQAYEPSAPEPVYAEPEPPAPAPEAPPSIAEPPRIHEAAAKQLHEEPLPDLERAYGETAQRSAFDEEEYPFGEPEIPMPEPAARPGDRQRRRDAKRNLDLDLGRIKRRKRYGLFITSITVLFIAFVLAPVTWATAYLFFDPPSTVLMMQRAAEGQTIRHYPVPINRMSPHVVRAVIAAEDANFCAHDGFDIEAIQDAMESNRRGGRTRGASTVSQQTAKNLFLWPERSWVRKGFETYFTALIEFLWPKRRIMEAYLNAAEWGDGNFGIEAAARARFGVSAADLTPLQAARLAAVLPSPNRWRADNPGPYVRGRASTIVARARDVRTSGAAGCVLTLDRPNTEGVSR
ncbi:MAG: monofunctional biosynthetic peptidoglycan transglycosylase [Hyphomonadaceae bacterium]|nr:monofunctional biosynthetic peptidoglycan transglycosylase [Hyphomonadaceae bacterium]